MPGRTEKQAREAFVKPLRRAVSCVTNTAQLLTTGDDPRVLTLTENPLRLRSRTLGGLQLDLVQHFVLIYNDAAKQWHVSTLAYYYRLNDGDGRELVSWHWHPDSDVAYPHLHARVDPLGRRPHLPTGRVSIEAVLRLLLTDLEVPATQAHHHDFPTVLDETEDLFVRHRRWHT